MDVREDIRENELIELSLQGGGGAVFQGNVRVARQEGHSRKTQATKVC